MRQGLLFFTLLPFAGSLFAQNQSLEILPQLIENYVRAELENNHSIENSEFNIIVSPINAKLKLPACEASHPSIEFTHFNQLNTTVQVSCAQPRWDIRVPVKIQHFLPIAIAATPLSKNHIIQANDVRLVKKEINALSEGYFQSAHALIGLTTVTEIPAGTVIKPHRVKIPTLIKRGDPVKIIIESSGLLIEARGVAQGEGAKGETVKVKNSHSNKIIDAIVKDYGVTLVL